MAKLLGIATHHKSNGAIEQHRQAKLHLENGLNDYRGNKDIRTAVTILSLKSWQIACREAHCPQLHWQERRANLLLDDFDFNQEDIGRQIAIGATLLEVTAETDPCGRMEQLCPGLKCALTPNWRGGARCRVIRAGHIQIGDTVQWFEPA
ncbi:MOSC domain-containing protein [Thiomicrorhabdus sp.]|uniref:MOSC domain-containing protein n=1 Tax=Thiomicrorhabdus sp. TaxID=2039724 RepID=UPI0029C99E75|nr:MOSC domain-containing protein [Thiomicrorhabdus sp.]